MPDRALAAWLVVAGAVGLLAAGTLLVEKVRLLADPAYSPSCSINPVLSCGSVMSTPQAELLGFPNPIIGVATFPILVVTGVVLLSGARLPRWYFVGLQLGVTAAAALVAWLAFQSIYRINALCPYCMAVWVVVIPTAWYVTLRNLECEVFGTTLARARPTKLLLIWHAPVLLAVFVILAALIGQRFWSYWSTLL